MRPINQTPQSADGAYERETIINFCDAEKTCSYYTRNYSRMNELRKLATEHPDEVKLTIDKEDCVEAEFPKKWVKIRPPMFISEERRAILVESGKKLAALSKEKAARKDEHDFEKSVGTTMTMKNGSKATCIAYHGVNNITVKFEDGFVLYHARWNQFVRGALHHNQKNINE